MARALLLQWEGGEGGRERKALPLSSSSKRRRRRVAQERKSNEGSQQEAQKSSPKKEISRVLSCLQPSFPPPWLCITSIPPTLLHPQPLDSSREESGSFGPFAHSTPGGRRRKRRRRSSVPSRHLCLLSIQPQSSSPFASQTQIFPFVSH